MAVDRGVIKNRRRAEQSQLRDFSGLRFGKITPTDVDCFIEYRDQCVVFAELKYGKISPDRLEEGQRLALERLADNSKKPSLLILAQHFHPVTEQIDAAAAVASWYRENRQWKEPQKPETVHSMTERFLKRFGYIPSFPSLVTPSYSQELPRDSELNFFRWKIWNMAPAIGSEGSCNACKKDMKKGHWFRVADGRITHLECVTDWESPDDLQPTESYELRQQRRPRA